MPWVRKLDGECTRIGWGRGHGFWNAGGHGDAECRGDLSFRCSSRATSTIAEPFSEAVRYSPPWSSLVAADTIVKNADGSSVETRSDGTEIITNADGGSVETRSDGTEIVKNADGSSSQTNPDGTKIITNADGSSVEDRRDGTEITKNADGSSVQTNPDGTEITKNADGTEVVKKPKK
jgi:hypothetical protein